MTLKNRIRAFAELGIYLENINKTSFPNDSNKQVTTAYEELKKAVENITQYNGWFVKDFVLNALQAHGKSISYDKLHTWISSYNDLLEDKIKVNTIGVVMAGNIPAVGFHDFLTVLLSGNIILAKLSSDDDKLLPLIAKLLIAIEPDFNNFIHFTSAQLKNFNAIIATGSNNTARYFEYYFGKYPNIIRKNRNGIAILSGKESSETLEALTDDIFLYYGLGCRNVSKLFLPQGYNFEPLLKTLTKKKKITDNHKYFNNYEYNKAIFLVNGKRHYDTGNLLLVEDEGFASPVSVVFYEYYDNEISLLNRIKANNSLIQCIVSDNKIVDNIVPFGKSQYPELWDYADDIDTMSFLLKL